jgi:rRNA biogenesis protein RRP5
VLTAEIGGKPCWRREEREKLNVWVAWLNLENLYGTPSPDEAVMALFQRALQHCDQKKLYAALLAILQRTGKVRRKCLHFSLLAWQEVA